MIIIIKNDGEKIMDNNNNITTITLAKIMRKMMRRGKGT